MHTKGPWRVKDMQETGYRILEWKTDTYIASIMTSRSWSNNPEANARLIAAAPQLLEACEVAYKAFCTLIDFGLLPSREYDPDTEYLRDKMYAAIAAAKGET